MDINDYKDDPRVCWAWPPNFTDVYRRRAQLLQRMRDDENVRHAVLTHYETNPVDFILDWTTTYDPRKKGDEPKRMPFCLFPRQIELVWFLHECRMTGESGLIEKCRDAGATFVCAAYSVWQWLFEPESSIAFGSRKAQLVDRIGDPDSIFQKMREIIDMLPRDIFWPDGFKPDRHMPSMKIINPENGAQIVGESGDNIGRGGRSGIYYKDESAHYERPELIEAALGDNTDVQIDISSVNGMGNPFYRRRRAGEEWFPGHAIEQGVTRVFIFDWRDHPGKSQEWYDRRRRKAEREGMLHVFAQEVDRDYSSAVENIVIPSKWVKACIDAHKALNWPKPSGRKIAGMDVADGGGDVNSMTVTHGYKVLSNTATGGEADAIGKQYYMTADLMGCDDWRYEVTGVGTGARAGAKAYRLTSIDGGRKPSELPAIQGWDPAGAVVNPAGDITTGEPVEPGDKEARRNKDHYSNLKAQAWFHLRRLCHNTYLARYEDEDISPDECISFPADMDGLDDLINELSQATYNTNSAGKLVINKAPNGSKSPNRADSLVIAKSPMRPSMEANVAVSGQGIDTPIRVAIG